jgi:hypothetical protein
VPICPQKRLSAWPKREARNKIRSSAGLSSPEKIPTPVPRVGPRGQNHQGSPAPHHHFPPSPPETPLAVVAASRAAPAFSSPVGGRPCQSRICTAGNPHCRHPATASTAPVLHRLAPAPHRLAPPHHRGALDSTAQAIATAAHHRTTAGLDSPWPETSTAGAPPPAIAGDLKSSDLGGQEDSIALFILVRGLCVRVQILGQAQLIRANKHTVKLSLGQLTRANKHTINSHVSLTEVRYLRWDSKSEVRIISKRIG